MDRDAERDTAGGAGARAAPGEGDTERRDTADGGATESVGRQVTAGLDPAVLRAGPPPVPAAPEDPWRFRVARPEGADLDLIHRWMNEPHVARHYGQAWSKDRWRDEIAGQLAGDYARPFLVDYAGSPVAYVELYRAARDVVAAHYPARPHDVGFHIAIGDAAGTGRGTGLAIFRGFIDGVFAAEPECTRIVSEPDAGNEVARKLDTRLGLRFIAEIDLPHKRAALFIYPRTDADLPPDA